MQMYGKEQKNGQKVNLKDYVFVLMSGDFKYLRNIWTYFSDKKPLYIYFKKFMDFFLFLQSNTVVGLFGMEF
jgi:hypothetical protein